MMKKSWFTVLLVALFVSFSGHAESLKTGTWRFELTAVHAKIPFLVEFTQKKNKLKGKLINGNETIALNNITQKGQHLSIPLQDYEITMELDIVDPTNISGELVRHNKSPKVQLPLKGEFGESERFPGKKDRPSVNLTGKWSINLIETNPQYNAEGVAIFEQKGNHLTGSILTPTGDYRYLQGYVSGKEFEAASFDGVYNYLIKGKVHKNKLEATMSSSTITQIRGHRNPKAKLANAYKQTKLESIKFTFPDVEGKNVSLTDEKFKNKPVIIQFFGSWCPNCIDEMNYLIPWYKENSKRGVEIVALSFERSLNEAEAKRQLLKVQKKNKVPYTLLLAGSTSADKPAEKIKGLKNFISFPTTVFLNKNHEVVKVHAGFTGPSTGEFFEKWKQEFNETIDKLLK